MHAIGQHPEQGNECEINPTFKITLSVHSMCVFPPLSNE
jgi:hypothetical protein